MVNTIEVKIKAVEELSPFDNEYVYDVIMEDGTNRTFFANGILVHNSSYFTMDGLVADEQEAIDLADAITASTNNSFPAFMRDAFNCQSGFDELIKANRELVCRTGLLQAKKKYMMAMVDKEGKRYKPGDKDELKTMGSDIKLSSTPALVKTMLTEVVMMILNERPKAEIDEVVLKFRTSLGKGKDRVNPLDLSSVISVKELDEYLFKWEQVEKMGRGRVTMPMNVRSTINHNYMLEKLNLKDSAPIKSGAKIKILWLLNNDHGMESIAFASETDHLPTWFTDHFEVNMAMMEQKLVDQKLQNIFDALKWDVATFQDQLVKTLLSFDD